MFLEYAKYGISVFACHKNKQPATPHGFYDASADAETLKKQFYSDDLFIAIPTGKLNGLVVIDFDIKDGRSVEELKEELEEFGKLPDTFQVETPSGGRHLYYFDPETQLSSHTRFFHKELPCDLRSNNGYVIAPGSTGYEPYDFMEDNFLEGFYERLAPLPEWIKTHRRESEQSNAIELVVPKEEIREIRSALNYLDSDDRDTWVNVGMALKSLNSDKAARGLWDEWSQRSDKYDPKDQEKKWKTFKPRDITIATIFHKAMESGWETTYKNQPLALNDVEVLPPMKEKIETEIKKFPEKFLKPGGLVQDILEYITESSIRPQPIYALAGALSAVGALAGRKYQTHTGLRTNLYCLCVGPSGSGKEGPRKAIKELFSAAGCDYMASTENLASDTAIENNMAIKECHSQVYLLDEIGRFLQTTKDNRSTHLSNVVSVLLKLFNSANQVYKGKIFADITKTVTIQQPNLCLYGTTVPETLYDGLTKQNISDGFLSRMMIFETDTPRPARNRKLRMGKPPVEIIDQIKALLKKPINCAPDGNLDHENPNPYVVPYAEDAEHLVEEFEDYIENLRNNIVQKNGYEAVYNRTVAVAEQVALIVAVGRNIDNPVIEEQDIIYGMQLAHYLAEHLHYIADNFIAGNQIEHEVKKLYQIIKNSGRLSLAEITQKTQHLPGHVRNDVIETLKMSDQIIELSSGNKRNQTAWFMEKDYYEKFIGID
jgi:hypothetical protein